MNMGQLAHSQFIELCWVEHDEGQGTQTRGEALAPGPRVGAFWGRQFRYGTKGMSASAPTEMAP